MSNKVVQAMREREERRRLRALPQLPVEEKPKRAKKPKPAPEPEPIVEEVPEDVPEAEESTEEPEEA